MHQTLALICEPGMAGISGIPFQIDVVEVSSGIRFNNNSGTIAQHLGKTSHDFGCVIPN
jgi:hypothetical protein